MTYLKPEITLLGEASDAIQALGKQTVGIFDGVKPFMPAYDLDE